MRRRNSVYSYQINLIPEEEGGYTVVVPLLLGCDRRVLTVPMHFSKTVPKGTLHAIIKQSGLTSEEFLNLS